MGLEVAAGIGVEFDRRRLPDLHLAKLGFLEIRVDPGFPRLDQREKAAAGGDIFADPEGRRLRHDPVGGRGHQRPGEVVGRLIARAKGGENGGVGLDVDIGLAAQGRKRALHRLIGGGLALTRVQKVAFCRVKARSGDDTLVRQRLLAVVVGLIIAQIACRRVVLRHGPGIGGLHLLHVQPRRRQRRVGLFQCDPVGFAIDLKQRIARLHDAVVMHHDRGHTARNGGADRDARLLEVGVFRRLIAPAGQPDIAAAKGQHHRQRQHQRDTAAALLLRLRGAGLDLIGGLRATRHLAFLRNRVHSAAPFRAAASAASSSSIRPRLATTVSSPRVRRARSPASSPSSARS